MGEKEQARGGFVSMANEFDFGQTGLWTRINCLNSPWMLDDVTEIVKHAGNKVDVIMLPKVEDLGTSIISTSCSPSSRPSTKSRGRS